MLGDDAIKHVVLLMMENHAFEAAIGNYANEKQRNRRRRPKESLSNPLPAKCKNANVKLGRH